jgi:glycosyltransferase involved in cell wall biosynthesis
VIETAPPELAVVVIGVGASPQLIDAVRSLQDQAFPVEIVVVNSGGGNAPELLQGAAINVPIIDHEQLLFAGAARNCGIIATRAPFVAFLASDCLARPGWIATRLARHRDGHRAVACAMVNSHPLSLVAWAHHLLLFMRRLPGLSADKALRYGVSFDRQIFAEHGLYSETMPSGEDTEFLARLSDKDRPLWEPLIQTVHLNETRLGPMLSDQFIRGQRYQLNMNAIFGRSPRGLAREALRQTSHARRFLWKGLSGRDRILAVFSLPIVALASVWQAVGILTPWRHHGRE